MHATTPEMTSLVRYSSLSVNALKYAVSPSCLSSASRWSIPSKRQVIGTTGVLFLGRRPRSHGRVAALRRSCRICGPRKALILVGPNARRDTPMESWRAVASEVPLRHCWTRSVSGNTRRDEGPESAWRRIVWVASLIQSTYDAGLGVGVIIGSHVWMYVVPSPLPHRIRIVTRRTGAGNQTITVGSRPVRARLCAGGPAAPGGRGAFRPGVRLDGQ